jgi:hypothetical protein
MATNPNAAGVAKDLTNRIIRKPANIPNGLTISSVVLMHGTPLVGIDCSALTSTAITLLNSIDGGLSYRPVEDAVTGNPFSAVVGANVYHHVSPPIRGLDMVKVVCGTAEAAARTVILVGEKGAPK